MSCITRREWKELRAEPARQVMVEPAGNYRCLARYRSAVTGANAASNKSPQPGIFVFTKGHYSIVTVGSTAPRMNVAAAANPGRWTDAEKIARFEAFDQFIANTGTYEVKGTTLTTHPIVAKNPATMGTTTTREFRIEGNTLVLLQTSPAAQPASQTTTRLTRIE
jgi:hypothetical protein